VPPLREINATVELGVKPVPVRITEVPACPVVGEYAVTVGGRPVTEKFGVVAETAEELPPLVTVTGPLVLPKATVAVSEVLELKVMAEAVVPLNFTSELAEKPVPVMVTLVPSGPLVGVMLVTVGAVPEMIVNSPVGDTFAD
jgi:hypothetical protein